MFDAKERKVIIECVAKRIEKLDSEIASIKAKLGEGFSGTAETERKHCDSVLKKLSADVPEDGIYLYSPGPGSWSVVCFVEGQVDLEGSYFKRLRFSSALSIARNTQLVTGLPLHTESMEQAAEHAEKVFAHL